jgi:hypothetical protein
MAKCKIIGLPNKAFGGDTSPKSTLQADPRNKSVVEAEKGETVVTNTGLDNIIEHFTIGGKKHGQGGTPLNIPKDSFIFSDRLKVKDKTILNMFGENKSKTVADVAKKYKVNEYKAVLKDPNSDRMSKRTAELNLQNAIEKLSQLALFQESLKGTPQGMSKMFEPFINKTKLRPEDMFPVQEVEKITSGIKRPVMAFGGSLPRFDGGGDWNGDAEVEAQYKYLEQLSKNPVFRQNLKRKFDEAKNDKSKQSSAYYNKRDQYFNLNEDQVVQQFLDSQKRNLQLKAYKVDYNKIGNKASERNTSKYLNQFVAENKIPGVTIPDYDKTAQEQLAYTAFNDLVQENKTKPIPELANDFSVFDANPSGISDDTYGGKKGSNISRADGILTNTTAGHLPKFKASLLKDKPAVTVPYTPSGPKDELEDKDIDKIQARRPEGPTPYWSTDLNNLNRALGSKLAIQKYAPFNPAANISLTDAAYYSPERAIAATNEQVAQGVQGSTTFSGPQQQGANFSQMQGQAFGQVANLISDYADKNVGIFNNQSQVNTQLANAKAQSDQQMAMKDASETATMNQNYDNAIQMAKDKIVQMTNAAITNRGETQAMNSMTEQYKVDPRTGFTVFTGGKALNKSKPQEQAVAQKINDLIATVPGMTPDIAAKIVMGVNSGKWEVTPDDKVTQPNELT